MKRSVILVMLVAFGCAGSVANITGEEAPAQVQTEKEEIKTEKPKKNAENKPVRPNPAVIGQPKVVDKVDHRQVNLSNPGRKQVINLVSKGSTAAPVAQSTEQAISQARASAESGDLNTADSILSSVATDPVAKCNLAVVKYREGLYAQAANLAEEAIKGLTKPDKCLYVFFVAKVSQRDFNGLSNFLADYVSRHPKSIMAANLAARVLIYQGKPSEAVRRAKLVLKRAETNIDVMKTLAMGYMAMKRYDAAKFVIAQIQEISKDDPDAYDMLANIMVITGKKRVAIALFLKALEKEPNLYDARIQLGLLYMDAGDYPGAEQQFRAAIKLMPGRVDAYLDLGTLLTKEVKFKEARQVLHKALEVSPDNPLAYFNLGVLELSDKPADFDRPDHYRKAIEWFKKYQAYAGYIPGNDPVYKYMDEAKRMAKQQQMILEQMQQAPQQPQTNQQNNQEKQDDTGDKQQGQPPSGDENDAGGKQ